MLVDGLDSACFAARMRLAGHSGDVLRGSLLLLVLTLALAASPLSRAAVVAALGAYLAADLLHLALQAPLRRRRLAAAH